MLQPRRPVSLKIGLQIQIPISPSLPHSLTHSLPLSLHMRTRTLFAWPVCAGRDGPPLPCYLFETGTRKWEREKGGKGEG